MFDLTPWKKKQEHKPTKFRTPMDHFLDRFLDPDLLYSSDRFFLDAWHPLVDIREAKKSIIVEAEMPGMEKKDIDVSIIGRTLTIKGQKTYKKEEDNTSHHRMECSYGSFYRSIELPAEVDTSKMKAKFKRGVLKVELKKLKETEITKIKVTAS